MQILFLYLVHTVTNTNDNCAIFCLRFPEQHPAACKGFGYTCLTTGNITNSTVNFCILPDSADSTRANSTDWRPLPLSPIQTDPITTKIITCLLGLQGDCSETTTVSKDQGVAGSHRQNIQSIFQGSVLKNSTQPLLLVKYVRKFSKISRVLTLSTIRLGAGSGIRITY